MLKLWFYVAVCFIQPFLQPSLQPCSQPSAPSPSKLLHSACSHACRNIGYDGLERYDALTFPVKTAPSSACRNIGYDGLPFFLQPTILNPRLARIRACCVDTYRNIGYDGLELVDAFLNQPHVKKAIGAPQNVTWVVRGPTGRVAYDPWLD